MSETRHPADAHDVIRVRGARENNLRDLSLDLPKRRLSVFTGVSGSGKSSLVFGTIAAESQRMINETYSSFVQGFMPQLARPDVDELSGLTTAIIVDQERMGANVRSTVGTVTDASAYLRTLYSKLAEPHVGGPGAYSFNVPSVTAAGAMTVQKGAKTIAEKTTFSRVGGMCPRCEGMGEISDVDLAELYDEDKTLEEGPFTIPGYVPGGWYVKVFASSGLYPADKPIRTFTQRQRHDFLYKEPTKLSIDGMNMTYEGLIPKLQKSMLSKDRDAMQPHVRAFVDRPVKFVVCPDCEGTRLAEHARTSRLEGLSIADATSLQITELARWVESLRSGHTGPTVAPLLTNLSALLDSFVRIGLGYLSLDRPSGTLSGGESQRTRMIQHLGSALTDVTYVFDEPTIGLHPHDIATMNSLLLELRDKGNTVLVVEHKPEMIAIADHVVDLGPRAGADGGAVQYEGDLAGLRCSGTLTGEHLDRRVALKDAVREPAGVLEIRGADRHNLQSVDVDIPLGVLTVVTGVAGSGKSSLVHSSMPEDAGAIVVDQAAIRGSRRSNPATYTGLLEPIRKAFAKANGSSPPCSRTTPKGPARCAGAPGSSTPSSGSWRPSRPRARSARAGASAPTCSSTFGGRDIAEVLALSVAAARELFSAEGTTVPAAARLLGRMEDVGLGYLTIGQPLTTLSGGERQRLKLATHMGETGGIYVLDEPTTGLHLADVDQLLDLLDRLVDSGRSVIVIEHHQAVMAHADHLIDLGPGAGAEGGRIVFEGTPAQLVAQASTLTGRQIGRAHV